MHDHELTSEEQATYAWQMSIPDFGAAGQRKLKGASVLISRCGGVGGTAAYFLAAAGIGKLVLAHGGEVRADDLNRQLLMTHAWLGKPRVESARRRLQELNPRLEIEAVPENISAANVAALMQKVDLTLDAAPLFSERLRLNREAVAQRKPLVECAMFELEAQLTVVLPGRSACLACLYPQEPPSWKRQFPVMGAVAGMIGALGAMEAIKLISGLGEPLVGKLLLCDLRSMQFRTVSLSRSETCAVCGAVK
ncbi:MAG TPA: HesA/MoeB/ThiF family protein [Pirellulales bacterium]|jgi:molybdopterin/thiamine biosynthesis adenylyltransferase|nr:HesA/MoeB/ThiF family protein [Pirellulales bacterium]